MLQPFSDFFISFFLSCLHGILLIISSTSYKYYLFVFKLFVSDTVLVHISSPKHLDRCGFFSIKFRNSKKNIPYPGFYISNLKTSGGSVTESRQETLNGKTVYASNATIAPGESVTYSFDVTTSTKAVSDLTIDQTPMGWIDSGVTTDTAACSINKQ